MAQLRGIPLTIFLGAGTPVPPGDYVPYVGQFDGTNDYLRRTSAVTGLANVKTFTFATWLKFNGSDGAIHRIMTISTTGFTSRLALTRNTSNVISVVGWSSAATEILNITGSTALTNSSGWVHVYICIDLSNTALRKIYVNGVAETLTVTTYTNAILDMAAVNHVNTIAGSGVSTPSLAAIALADLWFDDVYLDDTSKFLSAGNPVELGATGNLPTGSQPPFYFSSTGNSNSWATNNGAGGAFTTTGAITTETGP